MPEFIYNMHKNDVTLHAGWLFAELDIFTGPNGFTARKLWLVTHHVNRQFATKYHYYSTKIQI